MSEACNTLISLGHGCEVLLPGKLPNAASELELKECGEDLRRLQTPFKPFDEFVQLQALILPQMFKDYTLRLTQSGVTVE